MINLEHLSKLAYLDANSSPKLMEDLNAIIHFVDQLKQIDTRNIQPLTHPIDAQQHLRLDEAMNNDVSESLGEIAPQFEDNLYLVPRVL